MDGYEEAAKIDRLVHKLRDKFPLEEQPLEWLKFCRTVRTTMDLMSEAGRDALDRSRAARLKRRPPRAPNESRKEGRLEDGVQCSNCGKEVDVLKAAGLPSAIMAHVVGDGEFLCMDCGLDDPRLRRKWLGKAEGQAMEDSVKDKALALMGIEIEDNGTYQKIIFGTPENPDFDVIAVMEERETVHGDKEWWPGYWTIRGDRDRAIRHVAHVAERCLGKSLAEIASSGAERTTKGDGR